MLATVILALVFGGLGFAFPVMWFGLIAAAGFAVAFHLTGGVHHQT